MGVAVAEKHHVVAMQGSVGSKGGKKKVVAAFLQKRVHAYARERDFDRFPFRKTFEHNGEKIVVWYGLNLRHNVYSKSNIFFFTQLQKNLQSLPL